MSMRHTHRIVAGTALATALLMASCSSDPNSPGREYMPDMYRSPAVEAYVDYGQDPFTRSEELAETQRERPSARKPVKGTVPFSMDTAKVQYNLPYPYPNNAEGYELAGLELKCPIPMTQEAVDKGQVLYGKFCKHCHGEKGEGDGSVVANGGYPTPPSYVAPSPGLRDLPEGKIFHSITYGKNVAMGSHLSQLNKEERWLLTRYVQYLQNGGKLTRETAPAAAAPAEAAPAGN